MSIAYFLSVNDLKPKLYLAYDRIAFFEKNNPDLRISFDTAIRTRRYGLRLENGDSAFGPKNVSDGNKNFACKAAVACEYAQ